jgi:hypothetical protein
MAPFLLAGSRVGCLLCRLRARLGAIVKEYASGFVPAADARLQPARTRTNPRPSNAGGGQAVPSPPAYVMATTA